MSKPAFLNEEWYKDIQRQSAREGKAVADALAILQETFEIKGIIFGCEGDQFQKNEKTLIIKLGSTCV